MRPVRWKETSPLLRDYPRSEFERFSRVQKFTCSLGLLCLVVSMSFFLAKVRSFHDGMIREQLAKSLVIAPVQEEPAVLQSPNNPFKFRDLVLQNNIAVLLISYPETTTAAAALSVGAGSFNEGNMNGLAHFCEHMLFLGTVEHPKESSYNEWLSAHGGFGNAYTDDQETNFYFSVGSSFLNVTLGMFAAFFKSPLFAESSVYREMQAVDSEFYKDKTMYEWRSLEMLKALSSEQHAFHSFNAGNVKTLNHSNTHERLKSFWSQQYSANRMNLVLLGADSLDDLEVMAKNSFDDVTNNDLEKPVAQKLDAQLDQWCAEPFPANHVCRWVWQQTAGDTSPLQLFWPLPSLSAPETLRADLQGYLSSLIDGKQQGSLTAVLRSNGWAQDVTSGVLLDRMEFAEGCGFALFNVQVDVTEIGRTKVPEIVAAVFETIGLIARDDGKWRFEEQGILAEQMWKYESVPEDYSGYVSSLASRMRYVSGYSDLLHPSGFNTPPERREWRPDLLQIILQDLTPQNLILLVSNKSSINNAIPTSACSAATAEDVQQRERRSPVLSQSESWFGIAFCDQPIAPSLVELWDRQRSLVGRVSISLPPPNAYIRDSSTELQQATSDQPVLLHKDITARTSGALSIMSLANISDGYADDPLELWLAPPILQDPTVDISCIIMSPLLYTDARSIVLAEAWLAMSRIILDERIAPAVQAGYYWDIVMPQTTTSSTPFTPDPGIKLQAGGYMQDWNSFRDFVESVTQGLRLDSKVPAIQGIFNLAKQQIIDSLNLATQSQPYQNADYFHRIFAATQGAFLTEELFEELTSVNLGEVLEFAHQVLGEDGDANNPGIALRCLVFGNADSKHARQVGQLVWDDLGADSHPAETNLWPEQTSVVIRAGTTIRLDHKTSNAQDPNNAFKLTMQICKTDNNALTAASAALVTLLSDAAFARLRTQEQLGYVVSGHAENLLGWQWITLLVQGDAYEPAYLEQRTLAFLQDFNHTLHTDIKENDFLSICGSLVEQYLEPDHSTAAAQEYTWSRVSTRQYDFDHRRQIADELKHLKLAQVQLLFRQMVGESTRRQLLLRIYGASSSIPSAVPTLTGNNLELGSDIISWRQAKSHLLSY